MNDTDDRHPLHAVEAVDCEALPTGSMVDTRRINVPGGWLYITATSIWDNGNATETACAVASTFVPFPRS